MKKQARRPARQTRRATLPDQRLVLLDRSTIAWQDSSTGTWHGNRTNADVCLMAHAPAGFDITAVLQPDRPYLWVGIAAPDTHAARVCYATISGRALRELAEQVLQYFQATKKRGER